MITNYTLCVYTENHPGVLHRITVLFTRRKLNIESLTVSDTETHGISRFTIVISTDGDTVGKVARQIRRIIDVHEVIVSPDSDLLVAEVSMFKVQKSSLEQVRGLLERYQLNLLYENGETFVLQKTGSESQTREVLEALQPYGLVEFVRSGRIAMKKSGAGVSDFLELNPREPEPEAKVFI